MKITKQRILQIIKEELEAAADVQKADASNTKQKLRNDFLAVAKEFLPDADMVSAEVELTSALMNKILKKAGETGTSATQLKRLNDIAGKLLSEAKKEIVDRAKEHYDSLNNSGQDIYVLAGFPNTNPNNWKKVTQFRFTPRTTDDYNVMNALVEVIPEGGEKISLNLITDQEVQNFINNYKTKDEVEKLTAPTPEPVKPEPEAPPKETAPEATQEKPQADTQGVVKLPSGDKAIPSQFDELVDVFKRFSDDDDGFMMKAYLVDQDKLLGELRSALRRFIGLEGLERSLRTEQEEQQPQAKPEDKTKGSRESLVKYVRRYRRDINNTSKVMGEYLTAAQAGTYKAQPILNKLKIQLQKLQDDNVLIVRDLKALAGLNESLLLEEESREDKIAKVRQAYEEIVNALSSLLKIGAGSNEIEQEPDNEPDTEAPSEQNEELVLEDVYLEQLTPNVEELQASVDDVKQALAAIDSIKGYFRLTGTFDRPLEEVRNDFVKYIQDYKETMSDVVSDLKDGVPDQTRAQQYAVRFAQLADEIKRDFGVSPKEPIKVAGVPTVQPEGTVDETAAVNDSSEAAEAEKAQKITDESPLDSNQAAALDTATTVNSSIVSDFEIGDIQTEEDLEQAKTDVEGFLNRSKEFTKVYLSPLVRILSSQQTDDSRKEQQITNFKKSLLKSRRSPDNINEESQDDIIDIVKKADKAQQTILYVFNNQTPKEIVNLKVSFAKIIRKYSQLRQKYDDFYNSAELKTINDFDEEIQKDMQEFANAMNMTAKRVEEIDKQRIIKKAAAELEAKTAKEKANAAKDRSRTRAKEQTRQQRMRRIKNFDPKDYGKDPTTSYQESNNLLEKLIKEEIRSLHGKKMVRN